jgi:hypothetical protein
VLAILLACAGFFFPIVSAARNYREKGEPLTSVGAIRNQFFCFELVIVVMSLEWLVKNPASIFVAIIQWIGLSFLLFVFLGITLLQVRAIFGKGSLRGFFNLRKW